MTQPDEWTQSWDNITKEIKRGAASQLDGHGEGQELRTLEEE